MLASKLSGETQALLTLLTIDDELELHRYQHSNSTEPAHDYTNVSFLQDRPRKSGKQNQVIRKQVLPKLNTSKQELKLILRKLQGDELNRKSEVLQQRALQPLRSYENDRPPLKSYRELKGVLPAKYTRKGRNNEPRSQLSFVDGRAEEIQQLMKRNNYSANALNMKTLNILHQINNKNSRCSSGIKKKRGKMPPECVKPTKKNMVAFLRKVA